MSVHQMFEALADEVRRDIISVLVHSGECSAGEIAERVPRVGRSTVSSHLRVLRQIGLIVERKEGRHRYYSLDAALPAREALDFLQDMLQSSLGELKAQVEHRPASPQKGKRKAG